MYKAILTKSYNLQPEIIRYLEDVGRITVEKEYGYIRKVNWNDTLAQTKTGEEK